MFSFLTKLVIKFHTIPYILTLKWSAREPGCPVQQPRDLVCGMAINNTRYPIEATGYRPFTSSKENVLPSYLNPMAFTNSADCQGTRLLF